MLVNFFCVGETPTSLQVLNLAYAPSRALIFLFVLPTSLQVFNLAYVACLDSSNRDSRRAVATGCRARARSVRLQLLRVCALTSAPLPALCSR
jgi:hypothetical protein